MSQMRIDRALSDEQIQRCYAAIAELRPHVARVEFLERVRRQIDGAGYELIFVEDAGQVRAVAGIRRSECLAWGRFLYVDDLVTLEADRSSGYGKALLDWLIDYARSQDCEEFHLDSGVQRFAAHRFYLRNRMDITSHHFVLKL